MKYRILKNLILTAGLAAGVFAEEKTPVSAAVPETDQIKVTKALAALEAGNLQAVEAAVRSVSSPAAKLYLQACAQRKGNPKAAIQLAAQAVVLHHQEVDWLPLNELLCAELYLDLGLTNAAIATATQIHNLYEGTDSAKKADVLRSKIESGTTGLPK